jgi:hypothetical protein
MKREAQKRQKVMVEIQKRTRRAIIKEREELENTEADARELSMAIGM